MRTLVVGGGVAGLAAAIALTRQGIEVDLVEREATWQTTGAGITLWPNGERALRALALDEVVAGAGERISTICVMAADGTVLADVPAEDWDGIGGTISIHRKDLQAVLVNAGSAARLLLGVTTTALTHEGGQVRASFTNGSSGTYDLVVGADGIRSSVRAGSVGDVPVRSVGQMYWRTAIDLPVVDTATMLFDDDRFVALMPIGSGRTYLALQRRTESPIPVGKNERLSSLRSGCEGLHGPVPTALDAVVDDGQVYVGSAEEVVQDTWRAGRVVFIGDAAHALSPVLTQGGSLAIEDAVVLGEELGSTREIDDALDAFVARRAPRVRQVRELTARRIELLNAGAGQVDLAVAARETNAVLRAAI